MSARASLRSESGVGLIDVLVTILVITIGAFAALASFSGFSAAAKDAETHTLLVSLAQRDVEQIRAVPYDKLALVTAPTTQAAIEAPRSGQAAAETLDVGNGGVVRPGGDPFSVQGVHGRIYRYVTWRNETCPTLNTKVATQLSTVLGVDVSTSLSDLCPTSGTATGNSKRVTVVLVRDEANGHVDPPLRLSTVIVDPASSVPAVVSTVGLKVSHVAAAVTGAASPTPTPASSQAFQLFDTRCDVNTRQAPTDHNTRDTSANGAVCPSGGSRPDLMGLAAVPGAPTDPLHDYAKDITRPAAGGLVLMRDDRAGNCTDAGSLGYSQPETSVRERSLHTWATAPAAAPFEIPASGARGSVTLWIGTANQTDAPGRLCVTVRRASTGQVLGSADYSLQSWPGAASQLAIAFDLAGGALPAGERLLLTLRVPSDSGSDLRLLYDHFSYPSNLTISTTAGKEFQ